MAEFFLGKREVAQFTIELVPEKVFLACTIDEYWRPILVANLECGETIRKTVSRGRGISKEHKEEVERSCAISAGVLEVGFLKAGVNRKVSDSIHWEVMEEEEIQFTFESPECGRYDIRKYQKARDFYFAYEDVRFLQKNKWQSSITELLPYYHGDSKRVPWDPRCQCPKEKHSDISHFCQVDLGRVGLTAPVRLVDSKPEILVGVQWLSLPESYLQTGRAVVEFEQEIVPQWAAILGNIDTGTVSALITYMESASEPSLVITANALLGNREAIYAGSVSWSTPFELVEGRGFRQEEEN